MYILQYENFHVNGNNLFCDEIWNCSRISALFYFISKKFKAMNNGKILKMELDKLMKSQFITFTFSLF